LVVGYLVARVFEKFTATLSQSLGLDKAADYIFGYTIQIDVSDRGGRGDRKMGGSDWLIGKNHDTFGPLGPFIVPKEFLKDPMNTRHTFTLNGDVMQDSNTIRMDAVFMRKRLLEKYQPTIARNTTITTYATGELKYERISRR